MNRILDQHILFELLFFLGQQTDQVIRDLFSTLWNIACYIFTQQGLDHFVQDNMSG
jgi:hypothetical protein